MNIYKIGQNINMQFLQKSRGYDHIILKGIVVDITYALWSVIQATNMHFLKVPKFRIRTIILQNKTITSIIERKSISI